MVCMRIVGSIMVNGVWILIGFVTYTYFFHLLPMSDIILFSNIGLLLTIPGLFLLYNIIHHHIRAYLTDSSYQFTTNDVLPNIKLLVREECEHEQGVFGRKHGAGASWSRYCRHCRVQKPPRTHHCSTCNKCVLRMDHHCPWIDNCVGFKNMHHFYLFLLYLFIGCMFILMLSTPVLTFNATSMVKQDLHHQYVLISAVLCASVAVTIGFMLCVHTYLILTNQTTIEFYRNRRLRNAARRRGEIFRNPYDLGSIRKNFTQIFGLKNDRNCLWLCPWVAKPTGDGLQFPSRYEHLDLYDDDDTQSHIV